MLTWQLLTDVKGPASLDLNARKGRYGVAYMDAVATAAGCDMKETRPGADVLAVDCDIVFPENSVRVQIKTTHSESMSGTNPRLSYTAHQNWVDSWARSMVPVYFVVVVVPNDSGLWLDYHSAGTNLVDTAAYWSRIDASQFTPQNMSVAALRSQRVDATTIATWHDDLIAAYSPSGMNS